MGFLLTDWLTGYSRNSNNTRSGSLECYATDWLSLGKKKKPRSERTDGRGERERDIQLLTLECSWRRKIHRAEDVDLCSPTRIRREIIKMEIHHHRERNSRPPIFLFFWGLFFRRNAKKRPSDKQSHLSVSTRKSLPPPPLAQMSKCNKTKKLPHISHWHDPISFST